MENEGKNTKTTKMKMLKKNVKPTQKTNQSIIPMISQIARTRNMACGIGKTCRPGNEKVTSH